MSQNNIQSKLGKFINGLRGKGEENIQAAGQTAQNIAQPESIVETSPSIEIDVTASPEVVEPILTPIEEFEVFTEEENTVALTAQQNSQLQEVLQNSLAQMPEAKALAYVDICQKMLLGVATAAPLPDSVQQLIAAATADLFVAPNVIKVSNLFKEKKGLDANVSNFNEMIVHGDGAVYVFLRAQGNNDRIGVFSCDDKIPFGLVLHHARQLMPTIEQAVENPIE